jgi:hypothetical protein
LTRQRHDLNPLDTVEFALTEPDPEPHQPENWLVAGKSPELRSEDIGDREAQVLLDNIHSTPHLFGDKKNQLEYSNIIESSVDSSLELIRPEAPQIKIRERDEKQNQPRAVFELQGTSYDLPITDPTWKHKIRSDDVLSGMNLDFEPVSAYTSEDKRPLFTISLSSPYEGTCYKLVAAIIPVPDAVIRYIDENGRS